MSLKNFFGLALLHTEFEVVWEEPGGTQENIKISKSNYSRNLEAVEEMVIEGREFVIRHEEIKDKSLFPMKRGQRFYDSELDDVYNIREVNPLRGLKGEVLGYRVRCD